MAKLKVGEKSVNASWCLFRSNGVVRDSIKYRMKELGITQKELCVVMDFQENRLSTYLNNKMPGINQFQLYALCNKLGIKVRINIELDNI